MVKTDHYLRVVAFIIFLAMAVYLAYYAFHQLARPMVTTLAITTTVRDSATVAGLVAREEQLVENSGGGQVQVIAGEGKNVARDETLALNLSGADALDQQNRMMELETEIQRVSTLLSAQETRKNLSAEDTSARSAALALSGAVARHDLTELNSLSTDLRSLVLSGGDPVTQETLDGLQAEYDQLYAKAATNSGRIRAAVPGLFSTALDGWEDLTRSDLENCTPEALEQRFQEERSPDENAIGKLVTSYTWYYAAILDGEHADALEQEQTVELEFGRHYSGSVSGRVVHKGPKSKDDRQVVIFALTEAMADTMAMRRTNAELVVAEHTGIRVPKQAIHRDDGSETDYVYTVTGGRAERKTVEVIYTDPEQDYCLVAVSGDVNALRNGSEVIVSAHDLYDGKILN